MTLCGEGSNASSTNKESDLSQSSGERITHSSDMRGNSDAPKGGMLINDHLGERSNASSTNSELWRERRTHSSDERKLRRSEGSGMLIGDPLR